MGLDMYLYRINKLNDHDVHLAEELPYEKLTSELYHFCTQVLDEKDDDQSDDNQLIAPILPWVTVVRKDIEYIDWDKLKEICKIPEDAKTGGSHYGPGDYRCYKFYKDGKSYDAVWSDLTDEQKKAATVVENHRVAVWRQSEVAYWRKAYELQTALHDACDEVILNCGYYPLNDAMRKVLQTKDPEDEKLDELDLESTNDSVVVYHEWY